MKILLILTEFPPAIGGMQTHALLLSKGLVAAGHEIAVYTYRPEGNERQAALYDSQLPFPVHRTLSRIGYVHNLRVLGRAIERFAPDIVYSSTIFYGVLSDMTGVPVVARSVGNDVQRPWIVYPFEFGAAIAGHPALDRRLYQMFKRLEKPEPIELLLKRTRQQAAYRAARATSLILANSDYTRRLLRAIGVPSERIWVVVGGVDHEWFLRPARLDRQALRRRLGLPTDATVIMTSCRLVEKKRVDLLMEALTRLPETFHLVVVGDGKLRRRLVRLRDAMGLGHRVFFAGSVPYPRVREYYWAADIFALASVEHTDPVTGLVDAETMGRVLCEANAAGVPVVASRSAGIPSVVVHGHNGLLFEEGNVEALVDAIVRVRGDRELAWALVQGGLRRSEREFDWSHILRAHLLAFDTVLGRRREPARPWPQSQEGTLSGDLREAVHG